MRQDGDEVEVVAERVWMRCCAVLLETAFKITENLINLQNNEIKNKKMGSVGVSEGMRSNKRTKKETQNMCKKAK